MLRVRCPTHIKKIIIEQKLDICFITHTTFLATMEATSSKTGALAAEIQRAIKVLPASHLIESQDGPLVDNQRDGYICLQDWAFIKRFTFVKESTWVEREILYCIHHHDTTRDH